VRTPPVSVGFAEPVIGPATSGRTRWLSPPYACYRVYFGRDGEALVVLLTGGTKKRQQRDIDAAHAYWRDHKQGKRGRR
jgi:hypothetical protein